MPRHLALLLLGLLTLALGACQSLRHAGAEADRPRLDAILERGELRVGLSGNQPPLNMRNKAGEIVGLEVDVAEALAHSMGLELRIQTMPFADLLGAIETDRVDLVISGMTITPERNARVAFAGPYFISGKSLLTRSGELSSVEDPEQLDDPARTYAALEGSTSERFVKNFLPQAALAATPDYDTAVQSVIDGKVDALIADYPICALSVLRFPEAGLSTVATPFTIEPLGIAIPRGDPLLVNLVQNYLNTLEDTGLLTRYKAKWFSDGSWVSELP